MNQKQLNRIQNIIDGIDQARQELSGADAVELACAVLRENLYAETDSLMTSRRAAYLAWMTIVWREAGSPPIE